MSLRIVRLGTARGRGEGLRIGAVRRPPRGVPRNQYQAQNWYDAWLPELAPSVGAVKLAQSASTERQWRTFVRRYRAELAVPEKARLLKLLAALSRRTNFSIGCYCDDESRCHRSVLRALFREQGAQLV
jgi:uncharacterized protein YeaO (DUF488 family)